MAGLTFFASSLAGLLPLHHLLGLAGGPHVEAAPRQAAPGAAVTTWMRSQQQWQHQQHEQTFAPVPPQPSPAAVPTAMSDVQAQCWRQEQQEQRQEQPPAEGPAFDERSLFHERPVVELGQEELKRAAAPGGPSLSRAELRRQLLHKAVRAAAARGPPPATMASPVAVGAPQQPADAPGTTPRSSRGSRLLYIARHGRPPPPPVLHALLGDEPGKGPVGADMAVAGAAKAGGAAAAPAAQSVCTPLSEQQPSAAAQQHQQPARAALPALPLQRQPAAAAAAADLASPPPAADGREDALLRVDALLANLGSPQLAPRRLDDSAGPEGAGERTPGPSHNATVTGGERAGDASAPASDGTGFPGFWAATPGTERPGAACAAAACAAPGSAAGSGGGGSGGDGPTPELFVPPQQALQRAAGAEDGGGGCGGGPQRRRRVRFSLPDPALTGVEGQELPAAALGAGAEGAPSGAAPRPLVRQATPAKPPAVVWGAGARRQALLRMPIPIAPPVIACGPSAAAPEERRWEEAEGEGEGEGEGAAGGPHSALDIPRRLQHQSSLARSMSPGAGVLVPPSPPQVRVR